MRWNIYKLEQGVLRKLGSLNAPHQPMAALKAIDRWPQELATNEEQHKLVVRPAKQDPYFDGCQPPLPKR